MCGASSVALSAPAPKLAHRKAHAPILICGYVDLRRGRQNLDSPAGATIFIDAGSTTAQLVESLPRAQALTVVTRGLEIALALAAEPRVDVQLIGGRLSAGSHGTTGALALEGIDRFTFDLAFLGADAVDPADGVGEPTIDEAHTKERVAARSRRTVVLADAAKLTPRSVPAWARLPHGWTLFTDERDPALLEPYRDAGVEVLHPAAPEV